MGNLNQEMLIYLVKRLLKVIQQKNYLKKKRTKKQREERELLKIKNIVVTDFLSPSKAKFNFPYWKKEENEEEEMLSMILSMF